MIEQQTQVRCHLGRAARAILSTLALLGAALCAAPTRAAESRPGLEPCRLTGFEHDAWCGQVRRPLDAARPDAASIDVHFAVLPALARNRKPDPVLFFAGGPGQSAIALAGPVSILLARLGNRRDIVLIDQRGTGRSAPLYCAEPAPTQALAVSMDPANQRARWLACRDQLTRLPHGDLRQYTTTQAMQDAEAVRQALGAAQVNLVGGSYGTRAALEYLRQFPQAVRRVVIDGVAPPDMVMPAAFSADNQAALEAVFSACEADGECRARHPGVRAEWQTLLGALPQTAEVAHPVTGTIERITLTRDTVLGLVRTPLYSPALAAALPQALDAAARGRWTPLVGLSSAMASGPALRMAEGMHFSVICAEDAPRLTGTPPSTQGDFGNAFADVYRDLCAGWPRGVVPTAFYQVPSAGVATLVLSGGADPVTPPRHGERVAKALGQRARHIVVPQAGHGVMALPCMRDVLFRFIDAASDDEARKVDADCARGIPRPPFFVPVSAPATP